MKNLHKYLHYDKNTGIFTNKITRGSRGIKGAVAGNIQQNGYRYLKIDGKLYRASRVAWFYVYGVMPKNQIDHINRVRDDDRIVNLRDVTNQENCRNQGIPKHNTSGVVGVKERNGRWVAEIKINYKSTHIGSFDTKEEAVAARLKKERIGQ